MSKPALIGYVDLVDGSKLMVRVPNAEIVRLEIIPGNGGPPLTATVPANAAELLATLFAAAARRAHCAPLVLVDGDRQ